MTMIVAGGMITMIWLSMYVIHKQRQAAERREAATQ